MYSLNGGEVSRLALMRVDIEKLRLAADTMVNWTPMALGPMTLRPGTGYVGEVRSSLPCRLLEFVYSASDCALLEITDQTLRIWANDALVSRDSVTTTVSAYSGWTRTASTAASVTVGTYRGTANSLIFKDVTQGATSTAYVSVNTSSNLNKVHGLRIPVLQGGDLTLKIGSALGNDDIFSETRLGTGTHSIAFTPTVGTIFIQFESKDFRSYGIAPLSFEAAGAVSIPTPWLEADLQNVRYDQSADVVFCACSGYPPYKIERRENNSWSVVTYDTKDGPFPAAPGDETFKFTPGALRGDTTLTCNKSFFHSEMAGSLIRLFHNIHVTSKPLNVADTACDPVRVTGVSNWIPLQTYWNGTSLAFVPGTGIFQSTDRKITISLTGTWAGTVVLQRTFDPDGKVGWADVTGNSWTANISTTYQDIEDNVITFYRLYLKSYTSGTVTASITMDGDSGAGIARIQSINSTTSANIQILSDFYSTRVTSNWRMQAWNDTDGYPSSVTLHEGRLWWSGGSRIWGSVSDDYYSFDLDKIGDDAPISRSIGKGPIQNTNFMLSLARLAIGTDSGIVTARSSSFDEPLTPKAFNLKYTNTQGTAPLRGMALDQRGVFIQRSNRRVYLIEFTTQSFDYKTTDLTRLNPDIGIPGFTSIAIQRQIDTRLLFVRNDGQLACLLLDDDDNITAWFRYEMAASGLIENVAVLPGQLEDQVYVCVKRNINGVTKRYVEKFARLDECKGDNLTKLSDCHGVYSGSSATTITGLSHLEGQTVCVWGNGKDLGTKVVSSGQITGLSESVTTAVVGLPYDAHFVSAKLAYAAREGTAVNQLKRVNKIGMVLDRTHYQGVKYGQYDMHTGTYTADDLPLIEVGETTAGDTIWQYYDFQQFELNGMWDTDSRLYLTAVSPRPATVLGVTIEMETSG